MFAFFKRGWAGRDVRKWAGLFVFEFVVVLLGVLVAQSLQERFEQQQEEERFQTTQTVLNEQLQAAGTSLIIRGLQAPCIRQNLATIRQAARAGTNEDLSKIAAHPPHPSASLNVWSSEVARDARRYLEPELVMAYDYVSSLSIDITELRRDEEEWWANILMATEGADNLSAQERSDVVLASYKLDHAFDGWDLVVPSFVGLLARFEMEPNLEMIERLHANDGVCSEEVSARIAELRRRIAAADAARP